MADQFEINNPFAKKIPDENIRSVLEQVTRKTRKEKILGRKTKLQVSVALVSKKDITKLNKQYRKKEGSTDVLSFCYDKSDSMIVGEIVLSPKVIEIYAREDEEAFDSEIEKNLVHGLLHILGFEHGEKMFTLQEDLLEDL